MATKIKLMRLGKMRAPYYRIVVADARKKRDGRVIETIGKYHPKDDPSYIEVDSERAAYWLGVGAQPTDPVERILKVTGDWQKFKGEPAPPAMLVAEAKPDRQAVFEAAAKEGLTEGKGEATTPSKKKTPKADKAEETKAEDKADEPKAEEPKAEEPKAEAAEEPKAEDTADTAEDKADDKADGKGDAE